jgi:hypothetical protein
MTEDMKFNVTITYDAEQKRVLEKSVLLYHHMLMGEFSYICTILGKPYDEYANCAFKSLTHSIKSQLIENPYGEKPDSHADDEGCPTREEKIDIVDEYRSKKILRANEVSDLIYTIKHSKKTITINESAAYAALNAMELYCRISIGQFDMLTHLLGWYGAYDYEGAHNAQMFIKKVIFPELAWNASYGIGSDKINRDTDTTWDFYQTLRHALSWYREPKGGWTVNFDKPFHLDHTRKLATIVIKEVASS